jgi:predicted PhzF superfamily epimerase YddE/YHI9
MKIPFYQVDAFTEKPFKGNPAAVCPLESWLPDDRMQQIAFENNLAETAFFIPEGEGHHIRWFTPKAEVELCGHATLASAHVLFRHLGFKGERIRFASMSGELGVARESGLLVLDFPSRPPKEAPVPEGLSGALGATPGEFLAWNDYWLGVWPSPRDVSVLAPDFRALGRVCPHGFIATAKGGEGDFVSRFFAPALGIDEDPVTGSAHTVLVPFWAGRLKKVKLHALQVSARGGELWCELKGDRVAIGGKAVTVLAGNIEL